MQKYHTGDNSESLKTSESKEMPFFLQLPYLGNILLQSRKFQFILPHGTHNIGKSFKFKDCQALLHNAGAVYKLNCRVNSFLLAKIAFI